MLVLGNVAYLIVLEFVQELVVTAKEERGRCSRYCSKYAGINDFRVERIRRKVVKY
jgi:hypothetical protein